METIISILMVLGVAAAPVAELRGAIPLAVGVLHFSPWEALALALAGNIAAAVTVLRLFGWALKRSAGRSDWTARLSAAVTRRMHARHSRAIERLEGFALFAFVAVPLPLTGAWTGAFIAILAGFSFRRAVWPIVLGVAAAGVMVTAATVGIIRFI